MNKLIFYENRIVRPKGLIKSKINEEKFKEYVFSDDFENLQKLNTINPKLEKATLFYPGCGVDILLPLLYLEKLFSNLKEIKLLFNDIDQNMNTIKTILDDLNISFAKNASSIKFYWKEVLVELEFIHEDVFNLNLPEFNIYFERAFRIMKTHATDYEKKVFDRLPKGGYLISDSGFRDFPLKKIEVPNELSNYGEMIVGLK